MQDAEQMQLKAMLQNRKYSQQIRHQYCHRKTPSEFCISLQGSVSAANHQCNLRKALIGRNVVAGLALQRDGSKCKVGNIEILRKPDGPSRRANVTPNAKFRSRCHRVGSRFHIKCRLSLQGLVKGGQLAPMSPKIQQDESLRLFDAGSATRSQIRRCPNGTLPRSALQ